MALFIKAEELEGLISITEAVDAMEKGFASQEDHPIFSLPRQRMLADNRRITVHSGGCVPLGRTSIQGAPAAIWRRLSASCRSSR